MQQWHWGHAPARFCYRRTMMCQQRFSIAGLSFDIAGFLLIAFEWRHMFIRERRRRLRNFGHDQERSRTENAGNIYEDPRLAEYTLWREFQKLFSEEWTMRGRLFFWVSH